MLAINAHPQYASSRAVAAALQSLGPDALTEWLTRPLPHTLPMTAQLAEKARFLLLPALRGAFEMGFRSASELPSCVELSFVEDIVVDPEFSDETRAIAAATVNYVDAVLQHCMNEGVFLDRYATYRAAMGSVLDVLMAFAQMSDVDAPLISDMSVNLGAIRALQVRTKLTLLEEFPVLIWAGAIPVMNAAAAATR